MNSHKRLGASYFLIDILNLKQFKYLFKIIVLIQVRYIYICDITAMKVKVFCTNNICCKKEIFHTFKMLK